MKDTGNLFAWVGSTVTIATGVAATDVLQVILLVIGALSAAFSLFVNIYVWYKKSKQDGVITYEETEELKDIVDKHTHKGE